MSRTPKSPSGATTRLAATSAATLLGAALVIGCGPEAPASDAAPGIAVGGPADVESSLRVVIDQITGTAQQREAISLATDAVGQRAVQQCFEEHGFGYEIPPSTAGGYSGWEVTPFPYQFPMLAPLEDGRTPGAPLAASHRWDAARRFETALAATRNRSFEALDAAEQAEYDRVSGTCFRRLEIDRVDLNTLIDDDLLVKLFDVLGTAEHHPSVATPASEYAGCLGRHGFEVSERQQLIDHVTAQFHDPVSAAPVAAGSEQAAEARSIQQRAVRADAECRADAHAAAIAVVAPLITEFAAEHAAELERAAQRWEDAASA